ncbi:MAG: topoisomerase DNA-binding C4 zinc finger domain-containing protein [Ruminiclostridium sp.]|nr:topoisomerase DNA-binding C4 zinc finger domain-containing protein [Ruminiclostridium sp.]
MDHIVPVSKGGKSIPSNLRTLCERCNIGKSDKIETYTTTQPSETQQTLRCNYCGAELVLRHGSRGNFYGCSNYPRCKYTRNINQ